MTETKQKENTKLIEDIQSLVKTGKTVDEKVLKALGIDTTLKSQDFRNIRISTDFWNGITVSIIDETKDLDGNPIADNKKLVSRVKNFLENGTKKIKFTDLTELNIFTPTKEIILGNIRLKNNSDFLIKYDHFDIQIIDENKNIDGLWKDSAITLKRVLDVLHKFDFSAKDYAKMKELDLNKLLEIQFKKYFETVKKGGTSNQGLIDLILGANHNYGVEIKMAKELNKPSASQRAIGQIELYTKQFNGNFMLLIAGLPEEKNQKPILELVTKAKSCKSNYYYLDAN